ncbi:MAG: NosD domain-containing protein, partial [Candidatus Hodarchaeales archaeon]
LIAPYVISGYKIESNDSRLIEVQNTTVNFELRDNLIIGQFQEHYEELIYFFNVTNARLENNFISLPDFATYINGISMRLSDNVVIANNTISNLSFGIILSSNDRTIIEYNTLMNNFNGIFGSYSNNLSILSNNLGFIIENPCRCLPIGIGGNTIDTTISKNIINIQPGYGIYGDFSRCTIRSNTIFNNSIGIRLRGSNNNILNNLISNNSGVGISIETAKSNSFISNNITQNLAGIFSTGEVNKNNFTLNTIENNSEWGLKLTKVLEYSKGDKYHVYDSDNNINFNNFVGNLAGVGDNANYTAQAYDSGKENNFSYNYWDDWTSPNWDSNGIVDKPYHLDGNANNTDPFPQTSFVIDYIIRPSSITSPGWILTVFAIVIITMIRSKKKKIEI